MPIAILLLFVTVSIALYAGLSRMRRVAEEREVQPIKFYDAFASKQDEQRNDRAA